MNSRAIVKKLIPSGLFKTVEPFGHLTEAVIAQSLNGFPARKLKVIGVTGTDGKTSTSTLITQMLRSSGYKVAMMTTIAVDYGDGAGEQANKTRLTTVGAMELAKTLKKIKNSGTEWLVLETTSHALAQHRNWGVPYHLAVLTNISHEHLDYHGSFENYVAAKRMLFEQCNKNKNGLRLGVINADDAKAGVFASAVDSSVMYGVDSGELRASNVKLTPAGSQFSAKLDDKQWDIKLHLPGSFNVYNALAAVGAGQAIGLSKQQIEQGIDSLKSVEGRMARINEGQDFEVIVDYAHTPESFKKIFEEVKPITKGRLITVFGSAGRRDEAKRAKQGRVAGEYSDIVIITEEDDRDCDGQEILIQIAEGVIEAGKQKGEELLLIHNREQAVTEAIKLANTGDIVLLLGKGHEKSILTNGPEGVGSLVKRDYDEVKVARKAIAKYKLTDKNY